MPGSFKSISGKKAGARRGDERNNRLQWGLRAGPRRGGARGQSVTSAETIQVSLISLTVYQVEWCNCYVNQVMIKWFGLRCPLPGLQANESSLLHRRGRPSPGALHPSSPRICRLPPPHPPQHTLSYLRSQGRPLCPSHRPENPPRYVCFPVVQL